MNDRSFDSLSRQTAGGVSRRTSLMLLGAAGLMAALAGPLTADGGAPTCQDLVACCSHFATCDVGGFFTCFVNAQGA